MTNAEIAALMTRTDPYHLRVRAGIRTCTVAGALGIFRTTVHKWEHGITVPHGAKGARYARFIAGLARHEAVYGELERAA